MSHVDDGALHAYLDGALEEFPAAQAEEIRDHLERCAACAVRLEAERRVRAEAHSILALAAPEVETPSFEELRAYVERTRASTGGISVRTYRMRMAASVALALGVGWVMRGGVPGAAPDQEVAAAVEAGEAVRQEAARTLDGAAEPLESDEATARPAARVAQTGIGAGASVGGEGVEVGTSEAGFSARGDLPSSMTAGVSVTEDALPRAEAPVAEKVTAADAAAAAPASGVAAGGAVDLPASTQRQARATTEPKLDDRSAEDALANAALADIVALAPTAATEGLVVASDPDSAAGVSEEELALEREARGARYEGPPVVSALTQGAGRARGDASLDEEVETSDEPSLVVPGYEVVTVTSLGEGTAPTGVHVVQRFADGSTFEIWHLQPDVPRSAVPAVTGDGGEVAVRTASGWIVLRGPRPAEELEALVDALFPESEGSPEG